MNNMKDVVHLLSLRPRSEIRPPVADETTLKRLEQIYSAELPEDLIDLYHITSGGFLQMDQDDTWRLLEPEEILTAAADLHVDFLAVNKVPIVDCKDNDFICYDFGRREYQLFNIVSEVGFDHAPLIFNFFERRIRDLE
jgi:hypothetical protein